MNPSLAGKKICVMVTEHDPAGRQGLPLAGILGQIWQSWGATFEFIHGVPDTVPDADLLIPHLDLTVVPDEFQAIIDRHPNVVNRGIRDISKRVVSRNLVESGDDWGGPVIVKTNLNYGGLPEWTYAHYQGEQVMELNDVQRPWRRVETLHPDNYQVFPSVRDVPSGVWRNERLVVEKFMPEKDGDLYCMRITLACGDRTVSRRLCASEPIVKRNNIVRVENFETPPGIFELRQQFGLQFGKLDYVIHDGQVHLFDLNKTPGAPPDPRPENPVLQQLAPGIEELL